MKIKTSYADFITDWEQILTAITGDPELTNLKSRPLLEATLAEVKTINAQQTLFRGQAQQATQALRASLLKGKDLASQLRAEIRAQLGLRTERLVVFKVQPLRPKPRRKKSPTEEPTAPPAGVAAKGASPAAKTPDGNASLNS